MAFFTLASFASAFACLPLFAAVAGRKVTTLPDVLYNGSVTAESVSGTGSLDGQKLSSTSNATSYEW
jgi:hypothetical protein